jgi:hypothetical protein
MTPLYSENWTKPGNTSVGDIAPLNISNKPISVLRWRGFPHTDHFSQCHNGAFHDPRLREASPLTVVTAYSMCIQHTHCLRHSVAATCTDWRHHDVVKPGRTVGTTVLLGKWRLGLPLNGAGRFLSARIFGLCIFKRLRPESGDLARVSYVVNIKELSWWWRIGLPLARTVQI